MRANPEKYREYNARRYARTHGIQSEKVDYLASAERDGWRCYMCGEAIVRADLQIDHVLPLHVGGPHIASNLRATHRWCNLRKGRKLWPLASSPGASPPPPAREA
jgi:5-methylcytosine-specific restriction endonuclease McrA